MKIIIPVIVIIVVLAALINQNITVVPEYAKILEFSTFIRESNLHFSVKTAGDIPRNLSYETTERNTLAFGYLWVETSSTNEMTGMFTNHHLIKESFDEGWHTEIVKLSNISNSDLDFCLETEDLFSEVIIFGNKLQVIIPSSEFNFKERNMEEVYSLETILTNSCTSNIGARIIEHTSN